MTDLTKIRCPFSELNQVTQWALKGAAADGRTIEAKSPYFNWCEDESPSWLPGVTYRLKPTPREFWIDMCNPDYARVVESEPRCPDGYIHVREVPE